jgi:hypothetical protein
MTENNIILQIMGFTEPFGFTGHVRSVGIYQEFVQVRRFPGLNMDLTRTGGQFNDLRETGVLTPV